MRKSQKIVLIGGGVASCVLLLCPPWVSTGKIDIPIGNAFVLSPPYNSRVSLELLALQMLVVWLAIALVYFAIALVYFAIAMVFIGHKLYSTRKRADKISGE